MNVNWEAVSALDNSLLKLLIVRTYVYDREGGVMAGLQRGFPELFTGGEDSEAVWPFSLMLRAVERAIRQGEGDASVADDIITDAGIYAPTVMIVGADISRFYPGAIVASEEEAEEIVAARGNVTLNDVFPFNLDKFEIGGVEYYLGFLSWEDSDPSNLRSFLVVAWPCEFIAEDA